MKNLKNIFPIFNNVDAQDGHGLTELYRAARHGNVMRVRKLLRRKADPNRITGCGFAPLHIAAFWGEVKIVRMLLDAGADPNLTNSTGWSPLHSASLCAGLEGRKRVIDLLIEHGADKHARDSHGWSAHDYSNLWDDPNNPRLKAIFEQLKNDKTETTGHQPDMDKLGLDKPDGKGPNGPSSNDNNKKPRRKKPKDGQIPRHH